MKFLITVFLLTSLSAFAQEVGEGSGATEQTVTQPCDGKVDDQVTNTSKTEGTEGVDATGAAAGTATK
jgi:hypothetical protein